MKSSNNHMHIAKSVIALFIVLVAFGIFLIFNTYQSQLLSNPSNFQSFMILAVIGSGLLAGLLYLVNKSEHKVVKATSSAKTKSKKKKK